MKSIVAGSGWHHRCAGWLLAFLMLLSFVLPSSSTLPTSNYAKHGLFWSAYPNPTANIVNNGVWEYIDGTAFNISITEANDVVIAYDAVIEGLRRVNSNPLPREGNSDLLQVRCMINGVPYRPSSAFTTTYGVEPRAISKVANTFVVSLTKKVHEIKLQWKKHGNNIEKWVVSGSKGNVGFSIVAHADFKQVAYLHEQQDVYLTAPDQWRSLTNNVTFDLLRDTYVTISYSLTVQPQLLAFIKDRAMEYVTTRALIDSVAYTDSAETFGTNAWNPISTSIRGFMRIKLSPGTHVVSLQWKKMGTAFKNWVSNPSYLDGFACSRNIIISADYFESPFLTDHSRRTVGPKPHRDVENNNQAIWNLVGDKSLELDLVKESAVFISYALPVTQYQNPNFDANVWSPESQVAARVVVDGVAYTFNGDVYSAGSREFGQLFSSLALVLPAGTHTIALQWRSDEVRWTTLNDMDQGFAHGEKLMTFISSENAQPSITIPTVLSTDEDEVLTITSIRVDDIDTTLEPGMNLNVNITINYGTISFPNAPLISSEIQFLHTDTGSKMILLDSVANINAALLGMQYHPPSLFFGQDILKLSISDMGGIGTGPVLTELKQVVIHILPVDNMFEFSAPSLISVESSDNSTLINGFAFEDIDSQSSIFNANMMVTCGFLSIPVESETNVVAQRGSLKKSKFVSFSATYSIMQDILQHKVNYISDTTCYNAVHPEVLVVTLTNADNVAHSVTLYTLIDTIRDPIGAVFTTNGDLPRWSVSGLVPLNVGDATSGETFQVAYHPTMTVSQQDLNLVANNIVMESQTSIPSKSELVVLKNELMTYILGIQYSLTKATPTTSTYVESGKISMLEFAVNDVSSESSSFSCLVNDQVFIATFDVERSVVGCPVHLSSANRRNLQTSDQQSSSVWMKLVWTTGAENFESNYVQVFVVDPLEIVSISSNAVFADAQTSIQVETNHPELVSSCVVNGSMIQSFQLDESHVSCQLPMLNPRYNFTLALSDKFSRLLSDSLVLRAIDGPKLLSSSLIRDTVTNELILKLQGDFYHNDGLFQYSKCMFDDYIVETSYSSDSAVYCSLPISFEEAVHCCGTASCATGIRFDNAMSNMINASCSNVIEVKPPTSQPSLSLISSSPYLPTSFLEFAGDTDNADVVSSNCVFGEEESKLFISSKGVLSCYIPVSNYNGIVKVLTASGVIIAEEDIEVKSFPVIVSLSPNHGPATGGSLVSLTSSTLLDTSLNYACVFDLKHKVPALAIDQFRLLCITPASLPGRVTVKVLTNNLDTLENPSVEFIYDEVSTLQDISPKSSFIEGESTIQLSGSGFNLLSDGAFCRFGNSLSVISVVNQSHAQCVVPQGAAGFVSFSIESLHEIIYSTPFTFHYIQRYALQQVSPAIANIEGGVKVVVRGVNFDQVAEPSCIFGEDVVPGMLLNSTSVLCTVPAKDEAGYVTLLVKFGDVMDATTSLQFSYGSSILIQSVEPRIGFIGRKIIFNIFGSGFSPLQNLGCELNDIMGRVIIMNQEHIVCEFAPQTNVVQGQLILMFNGKPIVSEASMNVHVVESPTFDSIYPTIGSLTGGEIITIHGANFSLLHEGSIQHTLRCRFGDYLTTAMLSTNGSTIACITPASDRIAKVAFNVLSYDMPLFDNVLEFQYLESIKLISVFPDQGSVTGQQSVVIRGLALLPSMSYSCMFGNQQIYAIWMNETTLTCNTPPHEAGVVNVTVLVHGYNAQLESFPFTYKALPQVTNIVPTSGSIFGGTNVTVVGNHFSLLEQYSCMFATMKVPAAYIDEKNVVCITPAISFGSHEFSLVVESFNVRIPTDVSYFGLELLDIISISPYSGPLTGLTPVHVYIKNLQLWTNHTQELSCKFGETVVIGAFISADVLECIAPPAKLSGGVSVSIFARGSNVGMHSFSYRYYEDIGILGYHPTTSTIAGGVEVSVTGYGFSGNVSCKFGDKLVAARLFDYEHVTCVTAEQSTAGVYPFEVISGGRSTVAEEKIMYVADLSIDSITPMAYFDSYDGEIEFVGIGFEAISTIFCKFNDVVGAARRLNDTRFSCQAPKILGSIKLTVFADDVEVALSANVIEVLQTPTVQEVYPKSLSVSSDVDLSIYGVGFEAFEHVEIKLDIGEVGSFACAVISNHQLLCGILTPPVESTLSAKLVVSSHGHINIGTQLLVVGSPEITSIFPDHVVKSAGGYSITVYGLNFPRNGAEVLCTFGSDEMTSVAVVLSAVQLECAVPGQVAGVFHLKIKVNNITIEGPNFTVLESSVVENLVDVEASMRGGSKILVQGQNFQWSSNVECNFGETVVKGYYLNQTSLFCITPPHPVGTVSFSVKVDGVPLISSTEQIFSFIPHFEMTSAMPTIGHAFAETLVVIQGSNFRPGNVYQCALNERDSIFATIINENEINCIIPPSNRSELVMVKVFEAQSSHIVETFTFQYLDFVMVKTLSQKYISSEGGSIQLEGLGFPVGIDVDCIFNDEGTLGHVLDTNSLLCQVPASAAGTVFNVSVRFGGYSPDGGNLTLSSIDAPIVHQVKPRRAFNVRQQKIQVVGVNFLMDSAIWCHFQNFKTLATVVNTTLLECTSPIAPAGIYPLTLEVIGSRIATIATTTFEIMSLPQVVEVHPINLIPAKNATMLIKGTSFQRLRDTNLNCVVNGASTESLIVDDSSIICIFATITPGEGNFKLVVLGDLTVYSSSIAVVASWTEESVFEVDPLFGMTSSNSFITIDSLSLDKRDEYQCQLGSIVVNAIVVEDSTIQCNFDLHDQVGIQELKLTSLTTRSTVSFDYHVLPKLAIWTDVSSDGVFASTAESIPLYFYSVDLVCIVDGVDYSAIIVSERKIACNIPMGFFCKGTSLIISSDGGVAVSNEYDIESGDCLHIVSGFIEVPIGITLFSNQSTYYNTSRRITKELKNATFATMKDTRSGMRMKVDPGLSGEYELLPSYSTSVKQSGRCYLNGNNLCVSSEGTSPSQTESEMAIPKLDYASENVILIDSIAPKVINVINGSWIQVEGKNFDFSSSCSIYNRTLTTYVISPTSLSCFVPPMTSTNYIKFPLTVQTASKQVSLNEVELWYSILIDTNWRLKEDDADIFQALNHPMRALLTSTDFCVSKNGCDSTTKMDSSPFVWNQKIQNMNHTLFPNNASWSGMNNMSFLSSNIGLESEEKETPKAPQVFFALPNRVVWPATNSFITYIGAGLNDSKPICIEVMNMKANCFTQKLLDKFICELPPVSTPGSYLATLLAHCKTPFFNHTIEYVFSSQTQAKNDSINPSDRSNIPTIKDITPLHGFVEGGSQLTVWGEYFSSEIKSCLFTVEFGITLVAQATYLQDAGAIRCQTPAMKQAGKVNVALITSYGYLIESPVVFEFKQKPDVFSASQSTEKNSTVVLIGSGFTEFGRVFCRVSYYGNIQLILMGRIYSDRELHCLDLPMKGMHRLKGCSVSFNAVDYLDELPLSELSGKDENEAFSIISPFVPMVNGYKGIQLAQDLHMNQSNPDILTSSCSKPSIVPFNLSGYDMDTNYSCRLDDRVMSQPRVLSLDKILCPVDSIKPGVYQLSLVSENLLHAPVDVKLVCEPEPKVNRLKLTARSNGINMIKVEGVNFKVGMNLQCMVDRVQVSAVIDSQSSLVCSFIHLDEGSKEVIVIYNGKTLSKTQVCLTSDVLQSGDKLSDVSASDCSNLLAKPITTATKQIRTQRFQVRANVPKTGLTFGRTSVRVIADRINFRSDVYCKFGNEISEAVVVDLDYVICLSPPSEPGNVTLSLFTADNTYTWCCGWFYFHPLVYLEQILPSVVDGRGGTIVTLHVANLPLQANLYCHMIDQRIPAMILDDSTISCRLPALFSNVVNISFGSYEEAWSNSLSLPVVHQSKMLKIVPAAGSIFGGTTVQIPMADVDISDPWCIFGSSEPVQGVVMENGNVRCITAPVRSTGHVSVSVQDGLSLNTPALVSAGFTFMYPAEITSVEPTKLQRKQDIQLIITGVNFMDSELLVCIFDGKLQVKATWYSSLVIACQVDAIQYDAEKLTVQVSNNGIDMSKSHLLDVIDVAEILDYRPAVSFTTGNTEVSITYENPVAASLHCRFGGLKVPAIKTGMHTISCLAPRNSAGKLNVAIHDEFGNSFGSIDFEYIQNPSIQISDHSGILNGMQSIVDFTVASPIPTTTIGRLRNMKSDEIVSTNCFIKNDKLGCWDIVYTGDADQLSLDLSVNGRDYINAVVIVPVYTPSKVLWMDPLYFINNGGGLIDLRLDQLRSGTSTKCVFIIGDKHISNPVESIDGSILRCKVPKLQLEEESFFGVQQNGNMIQDLLRINVLASAVVSNIFPTRIAIGASETLFLHFVNPVPQFPKPYVVFQGIRQAITAINSTSAIVSIQANSGEDQTIYLAYEKMPEVLTKLGEVTIVDFAKDLQLNDNKILQSDATLLELKSKSCLLDTEFSCSFTEGDCSLTMVDNCTATVSLFSRATKALQTLTFCNSPYCVQPVYTTPIEVIPRMTVISTKPSLGPTNGGNLITVYGSGFVNDVEIFCKFGDKLSPILFVDERQAKCVAPANTISKLPVHIVRRGLVVSKSIAAYEYLQHLSKITVYPTEVSSLGGSTIFISVTDRYDMVTRQHRCRFNEKMVDAVVYNATSFACVSPSSEIDTLTLALSVEGVDISVTSSIAVKHPYTVLYSEPSMVSPFIPTNITLLFDAYLQSKGSLTCSMDNVEIPSFVEDGMLLCEVNEGVSSGVCQLSVSMSDVKIFSTDIFTRKPFIVDSIYPTVGFMEHAISVEIASSQMDEAINEYSTCCFGEHRSSALVLSANKWQCFSPKLQTGGVRDIVKLSVGLSKSDGFCEESGYFLTLYPSFVFVSASSVQGSTLGGDSIVLSSEEQLPVSNWFCRIGSQIVPAQYVNNEGLICITKPSQPGNYSIDVSINGDDFLASGLHYEFKSPTPSDLSKYDNFVTYSTPILYYVTETNFPSTGQFSATVMGKHFGYDSKCMLSSGIELDTVFVSDRELTCVLPIHTPGVDYIYILGSEGRQSQAARIEFVDTPSIAVGVQTTSPLFGPRNGYTTITIDVENLDEELEDLFCIIGDEWTYTFNRSRTSIQCTAPPSTIIGQVPVRLTTKAGDLINGISFFEYIDDPLLFDINPKRGTKDTELLLVGHGFAKYKELSVQYGEDAATCKILSNTQMICKVPELVPGMHQISIQTNGQNAIATGSSFEYFAPSVLSHIWPFNGPALKGGTLLSVYGTNFPVNIDVYCLVDTTLIPANVLHENLTQCRIPSHRPGLVNISLVANGVPLNGKNNTLQFRYVPDVSVDKIAPEFGYTSGAFPVFVFGSNFVNSSSLRCKFADMESRAIYLSNNSLVCLSPSPLGRPELANLKKVAVEVTVNGYDFSESGVIFSYSQPCDQGFFCPGMSRQLCPNGTFCPVNSRNFTLCDPGYFQPKQGQTGCVICPVGYICPDLGMSRPMPCPAGLICDVMGLRASTKLCPAGRYCLNGTKASSLSEFEGSKSWVRDYVSGVLFFNQTTYDWKYREWPYPAVGKSRSQHPPEASCDGLVCSGGSANVLAEAPFPCPIGHYCRAGAGTQIPMPKNFSSPQRCFDGFFCPRGSVSPEGSGPCPNGYFCPTQVDAIVCPAGHYCPGVGNRDPIECYPGTYNPFEGQANCTVCPTGYICPGWGLLLPEPCPAGFVCLSLGLSYPVVLCPQGYKCAEGTLTLDPSDTTTLKPIVCKEGEFCLGGVAKPGTVEWIPSQPFGVIHPQLCSEGTYCQAGAYLSSGSGLCFKGHYCPPNSSFPTETPVGNFASGLGSVAPTLCYPGTYAPLTAQVDCLPCPSGHSCISYGTYIPTICLPGTYRSQIDSVTCTQCPTGTYSYEVGSPDLSLCLPCPKGRICGLKQMITMEKSRDCPAGYICGYGTDRSSQFAHKAPAGYHTASDSSPDIQFGSSCQPGYYCPRGTATYLQYGGKCPVGSYCPLSTPAAVSADTKCPMFTTSLGGSDTVQDCRIADINVCDKAIIDEDYPMEDLTYYNTFKYSMMDDSNETVSFDSSTIATIPTGEIQVVKKIYPTNLTSSSPLWVNDTIEAFRTCPLYGSGNGNDKIIVIGRNFRDTKLNYCRFRACFSANLGQHPRRCKNQIRAPTGEVLPKIGNVSEATFITRAKYLSPTRMECTTPEFLFDEDFSPSLDVHNYRCQYVGAFGTYESDANSGNFSYVRRCDTTAVSCMNKPEVGLEFFISLTFPCTSTEILSDICSNLPEPGYMFNPCMSGEVLVEVTNDGKHFTTGHDLLGIDLLSTVRYLDNNLVYNKFKNTTTNATAAVYTYVYPKFFYENTGIMTMEKQYCALPRYSEEAEREREQGWFKLQANEAAHVHIDFTHLPSNLVYDEHYRIAIFMIPSRCAIELCDMVRVRLSPEEMVPCRKPKELPYWFQQTNVPKNVKNNLTVYALDDLIFKVEIHILYGLYAPYGPLFQNTTTVRIASPERTKTFIGDKFPQYKTRNLSEFISFEERKVPRQYIFCAVVYQSDNTIVSQPLNLPPLYSSFQRGRALVMNNVSDDNSDVPLVFDDLTDVKRGVEFWLMPATTPDESKELLDAYFETFQETIYDPVNGYQFDFQNMLLPYLPYFSNCYTFDSYIPIWLFLEGKECELPNYYLSSWKRYKYPALPDHDDQRFVGPFDFFEEPIADWCQRTIKCHYEEDLSGQDNTPRWFEASSGTALFNLIRYPLDYYQYTGRGGTHISRNDEGGGKIIQELALISGDNFIAVSVDHAIGDLIAGCVTQCFARSYTLTIAYYQEDLHNKRIIFSTLAGDSYDFDQEKTEYELTLIYYPLGFLDLIMNFAFDLSIFIVIFIFVGFLTVLIGFIAWLFTRATTLLQNPPTLRVTGMLALIVPPPMAGVTLAVIPIWFMTSLGNYFINGMFYTDPNAPVKIEVGLLYLDSYPLEYGALGTQITSTQMETARAGRIGSVFFILGFFCFFATSKMYFPRDESKRELEIARKRTNLANKQDLWKPVLWRKANFIFSSFVLATILVCVIELSFWTLYGDFFYQVFVMLTIFGELVVYIADAQLGDILLVAPLSCAYAFIQNLVGFGAPDFLSFLLSNFVDFSVTVFGRVYQDFYLSFIFSAFQAAFKFAVSIGQRIVPKYMNPSSGAQSQDAAKKAAEEAEKDYRRRSVEGVVAEDDESESVEPILEYLADVGNDTFITFYFPFFVYLLMQYRIEIQIPILYGIRQSDMMIYLVFQLFLIFFQPFLDILNHSQNELFHGWKIYEYLVYSRYRFLQRETRWKGMETALDECIEEKLRRIDQMCFSSQYFLMLTVHVNGMIYLVLAYETWLKINYSPFSDSGFFILFGFLLAMFMVMQWAILWLAVKLKVWKIKHENTAWHLAQKEEDELDIPAWEEIKGASTEAFLMNQRITSETFRYKFLNYNRTWLINQLPQILTPRTMRRSRPYLINQFARIINARRDDISDDSDQDKDKKFGPVALTAPSRNIVRFWLGRAKRRLRLRNIVEPLIKRARGAQCEQCLSRKQLQIEYEVDVDAMATMYDNAYPDDEEVDQVQWKQFWVNNQRYHTICLACLTKRKELDARNKMKGGAVDPTIFDDEDQEKYPDWGPVFLSAPSKAILLNWYRKAQKLRAGKRKQPRSRKDKVVKDISDDEGDDPMFSWLKEGLKEITPASKAIAVKWMRTARSRLQQKRGKGTGMRDKDIADLEESGALPERFVSGKKSALIKK